MDTGEQSLPEARGAGAELFTDRALFYLTNREQIDEWHQLRNEAGEVVRSYLKSLCAPLEEAARGGGLEPLYYDDGAYHHCFAMEAGAALGNDQMPVISAEFGWSYKCKALDDGIYGPYVGVRVGRTTPDADGLRERFLDAGARIERDMDSSYRHDRVWPVWRKVPAQPEWWEDLDHYASEASAALQEISERFGPFIRASLDAASS
jgi:hypothetical protein